MAPWRQPVMHSPHSRQPVRAGPAPPKNGSGDVTPGPSPKYTPTCVGATVSARPRSAATWRITTSDGVTDGCVTTPSMRVAWS